MKIIDLLQMLANGEETPKKIRVHYRVFEKYLNHNAYLNTEDEENYKYLTDLPRLFDDDRDWLNEEVEIIEEDKKIEKIKTLNADDSDILSSLEIALDFRTLKKKINELIDKVNKLERGNE